MARCIQCVDRYSRVGPNALSCAYKSPPAWSTRTPSLLVQSDHARRRFFSQEQINSFCFDYCLFLSPPSTFFLHRRSRFRGSRFHSRSWTAFGMRIYDKSVSFVRPNPRFGTKLAIIWQNEHFLQELRIFYAFFVLNPEPLNGYHVRTQIFTEKHGF